MNRLVVVTSRSMASAAPKITTGIEHAEKAKQRAGGKPEWSLYKCDDYLKFDKYSYAHAEITMNKDRVPQPSYRKADELPKMPKELTKNGLTELFSSPPDVINNWFSEWIKENKNKSSFTISEDVKETLGQKAGENLKKEDCAAVLLEAIRILAREKKGVESLLQHELCEKVLKYAGLPEDEDYQGNEKTRMEAQKCLINTIFNSRKMQQAYYIHPENTELLIAYLTELEPSKRADSKFQWIRECSSENAPQMWYFYQKIAFIATAMSRDYQKELAHNPNMVDTLMGPVALIVPPKSTKNPPTTLDLQRAEEALKTFFNVYCHFQGDVPSLNHTNAVKVSRILRDVVCSTGFSSHEAVCQSAIHALAVPPLPIILSVLCVNPEAPVTKDSEVENAEYTSMVFTEALLKHTENRMDLIFQLMAENAAPANATETCDLIGPYFQILTRMSVESKHVRRYCRLRILPPLTAEEVKKRPEENDTLRGKIVKLMTIPSNTKEVLGEFLFVICKRSVNRMIKYVGFGHSAGHLANCGLLGQINQPKHASDSEDSETEDYNSVRNSVNPVTGAVYPEDRGSVLEGMSAEQKEFEAMKLVEAIDKMMDAGIVKPGTIGEDGKVREVSHVLELIKNAPEETEDTDSD